MLREGLPTLYAWNKVTEGKITAVGMHKFSIVIVKVVVNEIYSFK